MQGLLQSSRCRLQGQLSLSCSFCRAVSAHSPHKMTTWLTALCYVMKMPRGSGLHEAPQDAVLLLGTERALAWNDSRRCTAFWRMRILLYTSNRAFPLQSMSPLLPIPLHLKQKMGALDSTALYLHRLAKVVRALHGMAHA